MSLSRFVCPAIVAAITALTGCTVRTNPEPVYATTEVTSAPVQIETYPSTTYERRTVYLYNDRWYYRDHDRWAYYREEPAPLSRHRHYVQSAPPAQRGPYAPPPAVGAPRYAPQPQAAPPAVRVQ